FSSSIAVFGPDPWAPLPAWVADHTLPCPQTSYGVHKLICEQLVADYTRKGYIFGNSARLMTVVVRPGKPNGAASSFFSGILREPLAGEMAICPVSPEVRHPISSPQATVDGLIRIFESNSETLKSRLAINLPALNVSVAEMLQALENVAGHKVRQLVHFKRDDRIAQIVANWPQAAEFSQASRLGLFPPSSIEEIINQYIADYLPTRPFF
ncbi:MAG: NAD-dependent epimerase, partial [Gammaproteobacteria bacterium]|nr:NAD-dependent epimerase [Gammaproteobacteria bacterium]